MPTYASGLSGQVGAVAESVYGTPVTVTHFYEFLSENFQFVPAFLDGQGLKAGQAYNRATRTVVSQFDVNGDLTMEHTSGEAANAVADSMGFWWKYALGFALTTPTVVVGTAYKQVHTNGSKAGQFITCQVGRPQISGLKGEPIENAIPTITGTLSTEFFSRTELYDVFKTAGTTPLQIDFTKFDAAGNDANGAAAGANPYRLSFILPAVRFKSASVNVNGPDIVPQSIGFQAYDDGSGTN